MQLEKLRPLSATEGELKHPQTSSVAGEELRHVRRCGGEAGKARHSGCGQHQAQHALVLIDSLGLKLRLAFGTDDHGCDMAPAMVDVCLLALIEGDDQKSAILEG